MKRNFILLLYILSFILFLTSCALWISIPDELVLNIVVSAILAICLGGVIILDRTHWRALYGSRQFSKFAGHTVSGLLIFFILALVNYLAYKHPVQWDISQTARNSLTEQSVKIVRSLEGPIEVVVFARKHEFPLIMKLLDLYRFEKNDIEYKTIDVELNPGEVSSYGITKSPTLVIKYNDKREYTSGLNELSFTNALIKLSRDKDPIVCYSSGHAEADFDGKSGEGFSYLQTQILASNLVLKPWSLLEKAQIDKECSLFLIWGPKNDFTPSEISSLKNYAEEGGHLMVGIDPDLNGDPTPLLHDFMRSYGLSFINGLTIDLLSNVNQSNGQAPIVKDFNPDHEISREFALPVFFPLVGAVAESKETRVEGKFSPLASSNLAPASWIDLGPYKLDGGKLSLIYEEGKDIPGPLVYAATWKALNAGPLLIGFANTTFVSNNYKRFAGNFSFFLNSLLWGVDEGRLISFDLPSLPDEPIFISAPQKGIIFYFSVIFLPLAFLTLALIVYWRTKKK